MAATFVRREARTTSGTARILALVAALLAAAILWLGTVAAGHGAEPVTWAPPVVAPVGPAPVPAVPVHATDRAPTPTPSPSPAPLGS
jgi:hypothetical protein